MEERSTMEYEQKYLSEGYDFVIGVDEAGRGPLAGPVVAVATAARKSQCPNPNFQINSNAQDQNFKKYFGLIRDSKKLSEKQREKLYDFIFENFHVGVGICDHKTIDRINILEATYLSMKKAIASLNSKLKTQNLLILIDGNRIIPNLSIEQRAIVGGDNLVKSISAASIIAKVTRDRIMKEMHEKYPEYNFLQHKGYGTRLHMEMIRRYGPCEIHRKSFRPFA